MVDPRWLEILKASSWQIGGIGVALSIFWSLLFYKILPPVESPWIVYGLPLAILICAGLSLAGFADYISRTVSSRWAKRKEKLAVQDSHASEQSALREYIPFLTEQEKGILGYLLDHNQKTFTTDTDGGRASTLYARSIVQVLSKPGQSISVLDVPFHVPDHLWDVLEEHRDQLPNDWKERRLPWRASY